jgi:hypothetical protein
MTGGNALQDYTGTNGFNFLTATGWGASGDVTSSFNLITSGSGGHTGIDAWLNGFDGYNQPTDLWGVHKDGNELYLTYEFSNLNFTPVPEPSTYIMTGALFCLIACIIGKVGDHLKSLFLFFTAGIPEKKILLK